MICLIKIDNTIYDISKERAYRVGTHLSDDFVVENAFADKLIVKNGQVSFADRIYTNGKHSLPFSNEIAAELFVFQYSLQTLLTKEPLTIGPDDIHAVSIAQSQELLIQANATGYEIVSDKEVFLNGQLVTTPAQMSEGDFLFSTSGYFIRIQGQKVFIASIEPIETTLVQLDFEDTPEDKTSDFHRSPRFILREPDDVVSILAPPTEDNMQKQSLLKLIIMPLAMIGLTIATHFLTGNGGMMIMMMGMSVITLITSVHSFFSDKKQNKRLKAKKMENYKAYLNEKYKELYDLSKEQEEALNYHYPSVDAVMEMAKVTDRRLYEKTPHHFDFLTYRLGTGKIIPSFKVDYKKSELTEYNEAISEQVTELVAHYQYLENLPITNDLLSAPTGYIGSRRTVIEQVQQAIIQLATFHSYHDVQFVPVFREEELPLWEWSRWLPHMKLQQFNCRSFVYHQRSRDQLLTSLYQMIKERKQAAEQAGTNKQLTFTPHYVFVITDLSLMLDHNIMEFINEDLSHLGISYLFVEDVIESLPEHVNTVVDFKGNRQGTLRLHNGEYMDKPFVTFEKLSTEAKEQFARDLAQVTHVQTLRNAIPDSVTFLEMYGVDSVEALDMNHRWATNDTYQTMAVPLGLRGRDELLMLNLHEKAHGPHGLMAGTTGSGKSETLQSYIASLAVNFHPYEVAFLLIDYKGGGMANLFADLPHLVGAITNLDVAQANRALVSIQAELKKRQRLFAEYDVNHINQYMKLFKEGVATEPMPHLFLISDEFAELKTNQPDFMKELVSAARIGRSLGIHLILATQKPSGVVDDQIWSNSKFKIALKVQDVADSREIIKTPDAAEITQTGRGYLQVGNNEIYELFQSAWSGADYEPEAVRSTHRDTTVYAIKDNGQYEAINKDLSGLDDSGNQKRLPTQLDAVVQEAKRVFESLHLPKVASPWLPPLKERIAAEDIQDIQFKHYWGENKHPEFLLGYQDIPEQQAQLPLTVDFNDCGHILVVGSPGYGKSTFIQNALIDVMRKTTPEQSHIYLYDFGTSGLISLVDFPHVADYFTADDNEKVMKSLRRLQKEVKVRKAALSEARSSNMQQYNRDAVTPFPSLFIAIDSFDGVSDATFSEAFYETVNILAREGASLGIYLITTMSRFNAMRVQLQANFKTKIALYLFEQSDVTSIVGRTSQVLLDIRGRGLMKQDTVVSFQVCVPYSSEDNSSMIQQVKAEAQEMSRYWTGALPQPIPMLPEVVTPEMVEAQVDRAERNHQVLLGLTREMVEAAAFTLDKAISLVSDNVRSVTQFYKVLAYQLQQYTTPVQVVIVDPLGLVPLDQFKEAHRFSDTLSAKNGMNIILDNLKERMTQPGEYTQSLIIIPDIQILGQSLNITENQFKELLLEGPKYGITPVFVGDYKDLMTSYSTLVTLHRQLTTQVFMGMRISDQEYVRFPYISNEKSPRPNEGYIVDAEGYEFVQLMSIDE